MYDASTHLNPLRRLSVMFANYNGNIWWEKGPVSCCQFPINLQNVIKNTLSIVNLYYNKEVFI